MLPNVNRLKKKKDFEKVFKEGTGFRGSFFFLKISPNGLSESRVGFVISKKVSAKAVIRNKLKRRMREIMGKILNDKNENPFCFKKGIDVVFSACPGSENREFLEIKKEMETILFNANLIKILK